MTKEQGPADDPALTNLQRDRLDFARRDLEDARARDLSDLDAARLILIITRLCSRLDDTLNLVDEVVGEPSRD